MPVVTASTGQLTALANELVAVGPRVELMVEIVVEETAGRAEDLAQELVPYDTGYLLSTISAPVTDDRKGFELMATAEYASYVEFGTTRMAPQPYLRPAFDSATRVGLATMETMIARLL